jgi:hypothetical protein
MASFQSKMIRGYRDYIIQSDGRIYSLAIRRYLKPQLNIKRYKRVALYRKGKRQWFFIHRLVASAFIGPVNGKEVHHIDRNKMNNKLSNLRILTLHQHHLEHYEIPEEHKPRVTCPF